LTHHPPCASIDNLMALIDNLRAAESPLDVLTSPKR
jgi:hypothetical protein